MAIPLLLLCWVLAVAMGWATWIQCDRGTAFWPGSRNTWWSRGEHPVQFWFALFAYGLSTGFWVLAGMEGLHLRLDR